MGKGKGGTATRERRRALEPIPDDDDDPEPVRKRRPKPIPEEKEKDKVVAGADQGQEPPPPRALSPDEQEWEDQLRRDREIMKAQAERGPYGHILPPEGRAPRGMGREYANRRHIVRRLENVTDNIAVLNRFISQYRGQKNRRYQYSEYVQRRTVLKEVYGAMLQVAESDSDDWEMKREIIDELFNYKKGV